ncbi:MAG: flavin reductase family protein [Proteobacteria bacterium]|nr:flavin reductase family protein [Pseudomonadota bacterium]MBU1583348.1 flavin reductase family protein [Pseudomonadota bacterium]MBU2631366.1 flavin reductase family protein [Pseudomonadota bacterium]
MKKKINKTNALYPTLTTILGTMVNGKPNFITIAHVGIMNHGDPQYLSFGVSKAHFSNQGILENKVFSVNIPSKDLVVETDYFGLVTGKNTDKSKVLDVFYEEYDKAPMLKQCPVTMECRLAQTIDFKTHDIFIGEIMATYANEDVLMKNGKIDIRKIDPLLFDMSSLKYWALGEPVANCWNVGKALKKKE